MGYHICFSMAVFLIGIASSSTMQTCDPYTATSDQYPGILISLDVVQTSPIKLRATLRLFNSTKTVSFEGILLGQYGFGNDVAVAACRSLECSVANAQTSIDWVQKNECQFTCPDGTSAMQLCQFIQSFMQCPSDAMSLIECIKKPFWDSAGHELDQRAANVICSECGP